MNHSAPSNHGCLSFSTVRLVPKCMAFQEGFQIIGMLESTFHRIVTATFVQM